MDDQTPPTSETPATPNGEGQAPLPIPAEGLPNGWTIEQWNSYGPAWIQQQTETNQLPVQPAPPIQHIQHITSTTGEGVPFDSYHKIQEPHGSTKGGITTAQIPIPGQNQNPYIRDHLSNRLLQSIHAPNTQTFKREIINSQFTLQSITSNQQLHQTDGEDPDSLIERMKINDEDTISTEPLMIRKVSWSKETPTGIHTYEQTHLGVRGEITNKRLMLIDSTLTTDDTLSPNNAIGTFFQLPRKGETFFLQNRRTNDIWLKPIPLNNITGIEISSSHHAEASMRIENRRSWLYWLFLSLSALPFLWCMVVLSEGGGDTTIIASIISSIILIGFALYAFIFIAAPISTRSIGITNKSRNIILGYYDPVYNTPLIIQLELEDAQSLKLAYDWCKTLQDVAPLLNDDSKPIIFN